MATSGPGATNLVTGIATAFMDSIPMVAITANVNLPLLGKDSFQEVDIAGVTMPITKHGFIVKDVNELASTIRKAFKIAKSGRPGPVLIDIPKDITINKGEYKSLEPLEVKPKSKHITNPIHKQAFPIFVIITPAFPIIFTFDITSFFISNIPFIKKLMFIVKFNIIPTFKFVNNFLTFIVNFLILL